MRYWWWWWCMWLDWYFNWYYYLYLVDDDDINCECSKMVFRFYEMSWPSWLKDFKPFSHFLKNIILCKLLKWPFCHYSGVWGVTDLVSIEWGILDICVPCQQIKSFLEKNKRKRRRLFCEIGIWGRLVSQIPIQTPAKNILLGIVP